MQQTPQPTPFNYRSDCLWRVNTNVCFAICLSFVEALRYARDAESVGKIILSITSVSGDGQPQTLDARAIRKAWDEFNLTPPP